MSEINVIQKLFELDLLNLFMGALLVIVSILALKSIVERFCTLIGYELPWEKSKRLEKEFQDRVANQLLELEQRRKEDVANSIEHDKRIEENVEKLVGLIEQHSIEEKEHVVVSLRSTLWRIHKESMSQGYITQEGLKTFVECGKVYEKSGGDDIYHDKLEPEILSLPIK